MIKEGLQFLKDNLIQTRVDEIHGRKFSTEKMHLIDNTFYKPQFTPLEVSTLESFVDYINTNPDDIDLETAFILIKDYENVQLISKVFGDKFQRHMFISAVSPNSGPHLQWSNLEQFMIMLQTGFLQDENTELLAKFLSRIRSTARAEVKDNGYAQEVTMSKGVESSLVDQVTVPNPVSLKPYRTFTDVAQPASDFMFRIRENGGNVSVCLFDADGGAWEKAAVKEIKIYLDATITVKKGIPILG